MKLKINGGYVILEKRLDLKKVYVELTNECNSSCKMCFRNNWDEEEGMMDIQLFKKLLNDLRYFSIKEIFFGGIGEATLNPNFIEMLKIAKKYYSVSLSTNGILIPDIAEDIVGVLDKIYVSLDILKGRSEIGHEDSIEIIKLLDEIKEKKSKDKPIIAVEFVVTKENIDQLPLLPELRKIGVAEIIISNLIPTSKELVNQIVYDGGEKKSIESFIQRCFKGPRYILPEFKIRSERRCNFVKGKSTVIRWDGKVSPCYRLSHSYREYIFGREVNVIPHFFGNIKDESLAEIWTRDDYVIFRYVVENSFYASCIDCKLAEGCYYTLTTLSDCFGNSPNCGDCLWSRRIAICP